MFINQPTKENTMQEAKLFYSTQSRLVVANAYASQIMSDVSEKICGGFECRTIAEFYDQCSQEEYEEVTVWNYGVFGKELCDSIDKVIDDALLCENVAISRIFSIRINESFHVTRQLNESPRVTIQYFATLWPDVDFFSRFHVQKRRGTNQ